MAERGLIVGKFYPPHRGHSHLIETARRQVDELYVLVCGKPDQVPAGDLRAAWLRELHPDVQVQLVDDCLDADDSQGWADFSVRCLGFRPEVAFTSEGYGDRFGQCLDARHVLVDRDRRAVPISGTAVRADPLGCWEFLSPPVRGYYTKRICLVGAESTGKTTLAQALAEHYDTVWVPEFGRELSEHKLAEDGEYRWRSEEFVTIAETQCRREDEAACRANRVLICDTDAFATAIWHRRYVGCRSPAVEAIAARHRRPDLYLLADVDTPFVQDGTRDGEAIRAWMHQAFLDELSGQRRPFRVLTGSLEVRLHAAVEAIDGLILKSR